MPTKELNRIKELRKLAESEIDSKASTRSLHKPIKSYKLTKIDRVQAKIGEYVSVEARDYIQALEHALYIAGFYLEKPSKI